MSIAIGLSLILLAIASLGMAWDIAKEDLLVALIGLAISITFGCAGFVVCFAT